MAAWVRRESKHEMRLKVVKAGIQKVAIAGTLVTLLLIPLSSSVCLAKEVCVEREVVSTPAAGSAKVPKDASTSELVSSADHTNCNTPHHDVLPAASPKFVTILAAVALALPFGLSTFRILRRNPVARKA